MLILVYCVLVVARWENSQSLTGFLKYLPGSMALLVQKLGRKEKLSKSVSDPLLVDFPLKKVVTFFAASLTEFTKYTKGRCKNVMFNGRTIKTGGGAGCKAGH